MKILFFVWFFWLIAILAVFHEANSHKCLKTNSDVPYFRNDAQEFDQYPKDDMDYGQLNLK